MRAPGSKCLKFPLSRSSHGRGRAGFVLIVVLMMLTLISVISVGMLSMAQVSLRASGSSEARRIAKANARVALSLAMGQLQNELGDDRRVTADGSILGEGMGQPQLAGVWNSAAGTQLARPTDAAPPYDSWKNDKFRTWLASSPTPDSLRDRDFARLSVSNSAPKLFSAKSDGFDMRAESISIPPADGMEGCVAWAISQEATKARINIGSDEARHATNDAIQAPDGPSMALSDLATQPASGWDRRAARVVGMQQAVLDAEFKLDRKAAALMGREHTAHARGVLANVVTGGLKTDMSLGFNLSDTEFAKSHWDKVSNPFGGGSAPKGEVPLFQPITRGSPISITMNYGASVNFPHEMKTGAPPTFQSLRSHYNLFRHLYAAGGTATAFQRPQTSAYWPDASVKRGSQTAVSPVLDRVLFFLSIYTDDQGILNLVYTPVVTLWNPYNVAIEAQGYTVFPWMDMPLFISWTVNGSSTMPGSQRIPISHLVGFDKSRSQQGRQKEPYFLCNLTAGGTSNLDTPIHLGPGEVRVFVPSSKAVTPFKRLGTEQERTLYMKPVTAVADMDFGGGLGVPMNQSMGAQFPYVVQKNDAIAAKLEFERSGYHYFVTLEDAGRMLGKPAGEVISEVQLYNGKLSNQIFNTPVKTAAQLKLKPQPVALLETFHRTAGQAGQLADLVYTVNPRQRYVNAMVSGSPTFAAGPHYESSMRLVADYISEAFQVTTDGRRSYYGPSNTPSTGRDFLPFFELPQDPMLSLGAFQHADLTDSAFTPGSQFGNAWASGFIARASVARSFKVALTGGSETINPDGLAVYDSSYLLNAAVWDGFYFSSLAPRTRLKPGSGNPGVYNDTQAEVVADTGDVIRNWVQDSNANPLRNPRHLFHRGGLGNDEIISQLSSPSGCRWAAAHMLVDGAFNVNSVNEAAWRAMLASLRGSKFDVVSQGGSGASYDSGKATPVSRSRRPSGSSDDLWNGFRELSDNQIRTLASEIVKEVRSRGPFQSLGEFVNRRISSGDQGLKGALQAAIDRSKLNAAAIVAKFDNSGYPFRSNLPEPWTGTGTPGWLTQADLLNALGPFITVRSDTYTIRAYGEAKGQNGNVLARAWCEAVVQRVPEWIDPDTKDNVAELPEDLTPTNARFGRRFQIVSFRDIPNEEFDA